MALLDSIKTYKKMLIEIDEPITDKVIAVQDDAESRYLDVQLFKSGVPIDLTGAKVRIYMDKPDGTKIMNDGEIKDPTSGRCQFKLTTQALAVCGNLRTQIKGFSESEEQILSTQIFDIKVTESLLTNETIESTNEYGSLVILFQDIYEALQIMTAIKNNFGEPGETAGTVPATTFWQMLEAVYNVNADALKNASVSEVLERIGENGDTIEDETLFGFSGYIKEDVQNIIEQNKIKVLMPTDTLRHTIINSEIFSEGDYVFLGYVRFPHDGFIKVKANTKVTRESNLSLYMGSYHTFSSNSGFPATIEVENLPKKGDRARNQFSLTSMVRLIAANEPDDNTYHTYTSYVYVLGGILYGIVMSGEDYSTAAGAYCKSLTFHYDIEEAKTEYDSII